MNKHAGYTEIKLADGSTVPLKFGMWTMREICKTWNTDLSGMQAVADSLLKKDPFTAMFDMIGPAAQYGAVEAGKEDTSRPSEMTISRWIDNTGGMIGSPVVGQVMDAFANAMGTDATAAAELPAGKGARPGK
ncbi:hypothetical protein [Larkinella punicea]|uniref:Uncharacterized protein n=1 Tax=Larkinella punicea TaxID=2315727 RepID=A0A368JKW8_9BACT|nr:hypothetical protein [Larkinella punicea]RCR68310.1 hypothetical protein DUE52_18110 [Larkinella punicea]